MNTLKLQENKMKPSVFSNKGVTIALAVLVSILWGTLFPTIKIGYKAFEIDSTDVASILLFAGIRFFLSGLLLVGGESVKKKRVALPQRDQFLPICLVGLLTVVLHYAFTYTGLSLAESSKSSVLKQIAFLIVPAIAFLFRKEDRCSPKKILAAVLGFLAVLTVNIEGLDLVFGAGEWLIILASFCSMIGQMVSKNVYDKHEPAHIVAYAQLFGGASLLISGFLFGGGLGKINLQSIGVLTYICLASIIANLLWNTLIKYNDMSRLAVLKSMDPLFASLFSALLLGENILRPTYLAAIALIILAITISNYKRKKQSQ
jgi:drug/metabolite transporter (DMT)-like permease